MMMWIFEPGSAAGLLREREKWKGEEGDEGMNGMGVCGWIDGWIDGEKMEGFLRSTVYRVGRYGGLRELLLKNAAWSDEVCLGKRLA
jgi:hypothetical protein